MKKVEFVDEGLIFTFTDRIPNVYVKKEKKPKDWPGEGDGLFEQPGYVMKYKLIHVDKDLLQSAGYELRVKYDTGHIISASGLDNLRLGINFEDGKGWQDKTPSEEHKIQEKDGKWLGYFKVIISGPTDPVVAWGP